MRWAVLPAGRRLTRSRWVGATRFETAVAVAETEELFDAPMTVGVAMGLDFPDALTGGEHVGGMGAPLLLPPRDALHPAAARYLEVKCLLDSGQLPVRLYGGSAELSQAVESAVRALTD